METSVKQRLIQYIEYKNISIRSFERKCGLSNGYIRSIEQTIMPRKLKSISLQFPDLNQSWLLTGEGEMLNKEQQKEHKDILSDYETYLLPMTTHAGSLTGVADAAPYCRTVKK